MALISHLIVCANEKHEWEVVVVVEYKKILPRVCVSTEWSVGHRARDRNRWCRVDVMRIENFSLSVGGRRVGVESGREETIERTGHFV